MLSIPGIASQLSILSKFPQARHSQKQMLPKREHSNSSLEHEYKLTTAIKLLLIISLVACLKL